MGNFMKLFKHIRADGIVDTLRLTKNVLISKMYFKMEKVIDILPLQNTIVFECESDMDDNPRAVYEYMISRKMNYKYKLVWIVRNPEYCKTEYKKFNVAFVSRFDLSRKEQLKLRYYLYTAKWFVFSHPYWFKKKREEQLVIFTNHGNPMKKGTCGDIAVRYVDAMLSTTEDVKDLTSKEWNCPLDKMFICGYPRNDLLWKANKTKILPELFCWEANQKVIMCMPTYKKSAAQTDSEEKLDRFSLSVIQSEEQFNELDRYLREHNTHLLVKLHPLQVIDELNLHGSANIHYIRNCDLLQKKILLYELLGCCDGLITDFSSVHYDFLILDRPVAFMLKNFNDYTRGFVMDNPLDYMPGNKIYNYEEFLRFIDDVVCGVDAYKDERKRVNGMMNGNSVECNSERFVKMMLSGEIENILKKNKGEICDS